MRKSIQIKSIYSYIVLATLVLAVAIRGGATLGEQPTEETKPVATYSIEDIRTVFPEAATFYSKQGRGIVVKNNQGEQLGRLLLSTDFEVHNVGYAGEVPLFVGLDKQNQIIGIHLLPNEETPSFIEYIRKKNWKGDL